MRFLQSFLVSMLKKTILLIGISLLVFPSLSFAAVTHDFVCADMPSMDGSVSCVADTWVASSPGSALDDGTHYALPIGTWYIYADVINHANFSMYCYNGVANPCDNPSYSADGVGYVTMTVSSPAGLYIFGNGGGGWTVGSLCATDVIGGCDSVTPTTSATSTLISDPNRDFFNGIILFMVGMIFTVWLITKR